MPEKIQIIHGDCLEELPRLSEKSINLILTDLPYSQTQCSWDVQIPLAPLWEAWKRVLAPKGVIALTASQPFTSQLVLSNLEMYKHEIIWIKNRGSNFANTHREPMKEHESVLIFAGKNWTYNRQMQERTGGGAERVKYPVEWKTSSENYGKFAGQEPKKVPQLRVPSSWQKFNVEVGLHPTQKPVTLFQYLIKTYSNPGDLVLDCCAGSGTTGVAALKTGRRALLIEKEAKYVEVIKKRLLDLNELDGHPEAV